MAWNFDAIYVAYVSGRRWSMRLYIDLGVPRPISHSPEYDNAFYMRHKQKFMGDAWTKLLFVRYPYPM
jgi:hypothetical protein